MTDASELERLAALLPEHGGIPSQPIHFGGDREQWAAFCYGHLFVTARDSITYARQCEDRAREMSEVLRESRDWIIAAGHQNHACLGLANPCACGVHKLIDRIDRASEGKREGEKA